MTVLEIFERVTATGGGVIGVLVVSNKTWFQKWYKNYRNNRDAWREMIRGTIKELEKDLIFIKEQT